MPSGLPRVARGAAHAELTDIAPTPDLLSLRGGNRRSNPSYAVPVTLTSTAGLPSRIPIQVRYARQLPPTLGVRRPPPSRIYPRPLRGGEAARSNPQRVDQRSKGSESAPLPTRRHSHIRRRCRRRPPPAGEPEGCPLGNSFQFIEGGGGAARSDAQQEDARHTSTIRPLLGTAL